jgi:hypothetical protein
LGFNDRSRLGRALRVGILWAVSTEALNETGAHTQGKYEYFEKVQSKFLLNSNASIAG